MISRRKIANRLDDLRHRIMTYPVDVIPAPRDRVIDNVETASPIPLTIAQTFRTAVVPRPIHSAVTRWQETNPEFDYRFFDDDAARGFIEEHFPRDVLEAYDSLRPTAFRADIWRYCYLAKNGGVYIDIRMEPLFALRTILDLRSARPPAFVAARDRGSGFMYNAFIAAAPGHPFVVAALERAVTMVRNKDYAGHCLGITGPACFGAAISGQLGKSVESHFELGDHDDEKVGRYRVLDHCKDPFHRSVLTLNGRPCISTKCIHGSMSKADRSFPDLRYDELYRKRLVFR